MRRLSPKTVLRIAAIIFALLILSLIVPTLNTSGKFEWLSASPGNDPPHFKFLGRWGWKVNGWFTSLMKKVTGTPRSNLIVSTVYFIDSTANLVPESEVAWRTTNEFGDQAWLLHRPQSLKATSCGKPVSISVAEGRQAQISSHSRTPVYRRGETNVVLHDIGYWLNAWLIQGRKGFNSTFFLVANERVTAPEGQLVHTNACLGGSLHIPNQHVLLLISARTNAHGQYMAAHIAPSAAP